MSTSHYGAQAPTSYMTRGSRSGFIGAPGDSSDAAAIAAARSGWYDTSSSSSGGFWGPASSPATVAAVVVDARPLPVRATAAQGTEGNWVACVGRRGLCFDPRRTLSVAEQRNSHSPRAWAWQAWARARGWF
jgi:hypothetical protein